MFQNDAPAMFSSKSLPKLAWLAGLGGILGGSQAVLGLLLGAGGARFALAFAIMGALVLAASSGMSRPAIAGVVILTGRVGVLALSATFGVAVGLLWLGPTTTSTSPAIPPAGWMILLAIVAGVAGGTSLAFNLSRWWSLASLGSTVFVGIAAGAGLGQFFAWLTAKFHIWGIASGAGLGAALSWLVQPRQRDGDGTIARQLEYGLLFIVVLLVLFNSVMPAAWDDTGVFNLYVHQAASFLRGRLDIEPPNTLDTALYGGKRYVPFPPFPALILLPLIWLPGSPTTPSIPMRLVSAGLGALSAILLMASLHQLGIERGRRYWLVAAFIFGTGFWLVMQGAERFATYFAHIVSVASLLLALREAQDKGRGLLAGLFLGTAFLSRQLTIFAAIFVAMLLLEQTNGRSKNRRWLNLLGFAGGLTLCIGAYLLFNLLRFGSPWDTGYSYISYGGHQAERFWQFGLFNLVYVPSNLYFLFLKGFHIEFEGPALLTPRQMDPFGTSITFASPFLFLAVLCRWKRRLAWAAWVSVLLMLLGHLLYLNNGFVQINAQRFMLDYLPILILLVALAEKHVKRGILEGLVLYSIGLNLIALFLIAWPWLR